MRTAAYLADKYRANVAKLISSSGRSEFHSLSWKDSLKFHILYDQSFRVTAISNHEFFVDCHAGEEGLIELPIFHDCMLSDFLLNGRRIKEQYSNAILIKEKRSSAPWSLVTAYYCAFFSANELLRLHGRIPLGLDQDDIYHLNAKLTAETAEIRQSFIATAKNNFIGQIRDGKIIFRSTGTAPHAYAWSETGKVLAEIAKETGWADELSSFIKLANARNEDHSFKSPSFIRNEWNYKRADLYSSKGRRICEGMFSLLGNHRKALEWLKCATSLDEMGKASAIASITEFLAIPVIASYDAAFATNQITMNNK